MNKIKNRIYLSSPHMSGNEIKYVQEAFDQNWVAPLGPNVDAFEQDIAEYCNVKHAAALSSGTAAIHLALIILGVKPGDEVIASTFTFSATINPIVYQGAIPVLIDSEKDSWNMDPDLLEEAIKERNALGKNVKAIIVVHLYGMPAKMNPIMEIANRYNIPIIEDAAEALGSTYEGRQVGSFGTIGILSFNGNKIITTSGGGALISNEYDIVKEARYLATQAREKCVHYQHLKVGYNYRMSNVLAGIGRGQMEVLDRYIEKRRENFNFYYDKFKLLPCIKMLREPNQLYKSNRWLTTLLFEEDVTGGWRHIQEIMDKNNIETRPLWKPMHLQPIFSSFPKYLNGVSEENFNNGLCIPSGSNLTEINRRYVADIITSIIENR